jgi:hypothetical protein
MLAHPHNDGFGLKPDDHRVISAQSRLDKATAEAKRKTELKQTRSAAWHSASLTLANVEQWLRDGRPAGTMLEAVEVEPPKLLKGEDVLSALERVLRRGRELKADLARIAAAPFPSAHARAKIRQEVETLAQRGAPVVSGVIEHDGKLEFPRVLVRSQVHNVRKSPAAVAYAEAVDPAALVAWLFPDELIAALDREIDSESDDKGALTLEAREKAQAEVMGDLLAVERAEAWLVWQAQAQSLPVEHRADCAPAAILSVQVVTARRAVPSLGSSPEHAINFVGPGR